jgi:hypothetical protein
MQTEQTKNTASPILIPRFLLPAAGVDPTLWAVVACDQFSSEPDYWRKVEALVGQAPSTLRLILPECFLDEGDQLARIQTIWSEMQRYLAQGLLRETDPGLMLVERATPFTARRRGLVLAVDLERYEYSPGSASLIRPTESTILERIPPRMDIRRRAALELPHILVLVDDPDDRLLGALFDEQAGLAPAYQGELMSGAGRIEGRFIPAGEITARFEARLADFIREKRSIQPGVEPFLFAVGDGNHSLATAKAVWEERKSGLSPEQAADHPARFALVELVNLYDPGIRFEPIHRLLRGSQAAQFLRFLAQKGFQVEKGKLPALDEVQAGPQVFGLVGGGLRAGLQASGQTHPAPAGTIQPLIEEYLKANPSAGIDYIHGRESILQLAAGPDRLGVLVPPMAKQLLFPTVARLGVLPRKAFSIGEALEKRFYFEARRL